MIYDALRQAQPGAAPASPSGTPSANGIRLAQRTHRAWLLPGLGAALCVGTLVLALGHFRAERVAPAAPTVAAAAPVVPAAATSTDTTVPATEAEPISDSPTASLPPLPAFSRQANAPATPVAVSTTTQPVVSTQPVKPNAVEGTSNPGIANTAPSTDAVKDVRSDHLDIRVARAEETPASTDLDVSAHLKGLDRALSDRNAQATAQHLSVLTAKLPASSLTLMRAQAWAAHSLGDTDAAESHYRAILERVPDDEQAGVNLALLEAARGDRDAAHTRLRRLASLNGNSPLIARAMGQLSGAASL